MTTIAERTRSSIKETIAGGENPADFFWPFNGLRPDGEKFSMDMAEFVVWASALHPEIVDEETGAPLVYDFVFTKLDEECSGNEGLAGTVMVTVRPDIDDRVSYYEIAAEAARRYPANPVIRHRFEVLAGMFKEMGM
jgi:hypothetical protein